MAAPALETKQPRTQRQQVNGFLRRNGLQVGIVGVLVVIWLFLIVAAPRAFGSKEIYGALMQLVVAQEIDLSFGSIMAISVVGFLEVFNATGSPILALIACLVVGLIC